MNWAFNELSSKQSKPYMKNNQPGILSIGRKIALCLILAHFIISCSGNSNKNTGDKKDSANKSGSSATNENKVETDYAVIATDACDCISDFENAMSDDGRKLVIEAAKDGRLDTVYRAFNQTDREVYESEGKKTFNCLKGLEKKYPFFNHPTSKELKAYRDAVEEHCSEFAAAWAPR